MVRFYNSRDSTSSRTFLVVFFPGKLVADKLDDEACKAYGSLPDRLYVVHKGNVVYQGGRGPFEYKVLA